ncbi:MAG: hypothetical protein LBC95_01510 [Candidatus Nomurabacteria bacterium]|jgi:hypothetical protein|nr:hypothetical protein [Candidatus Nomurabacteria bacterium]
MIPADEGHVVGEKKYINGEEVSKELFHEVSFLRRTTLKAANKLEVFLLRFRLVVCAIYSGVIITFVIKFLIDSILIGAVIFLVLLVMNFMFNTKSEILKYVNLLKEQQPDNAGKPD